MGVIEEGIISVVTPKSSSEKPRKSRPRGKAKLNGQIQPDASDPKSQETQINEIGDDDDSVSEEICHICSSPISIKAYYPCTHTVCHKCAMRRRALARDFTCLFCRTDCPKIIMSRHVEKLQNDLDIQYEDTTYGIQFDEKKTRDKTLKLMEISCPFKSCSEHGNILGKWSNLKKHMKEDHGRRYCDLCLKHVQSFCYEQKTYTPKQLKVHEQHGDKQQGFSGHPLCKFCQVRYYTNDELMAHCVKDHEKCFVCQKLDPVAPPRFFKDYLQLEEHFLDEHFACKIQSCIDKKFVVFRYQEELVHHMLEEHGDIIGKSRVTLNTEIPMRRYHSQLSTIPASGSTSTSMLSSRNGTASLRNNETLFPELNSASSSRQRSIPQPQPANVASFHATLPSQDNTINSISRRLQERAKILLQKNPHHLKQFNDINTSYASDKSDINENELIDNYKSLFSESNDDQLDILIHEFAETLKVSNKKKAQKLQSVYEQHIADRPSRPAPKAVVSSAPVAGTWANRSNNARQARAASSFPSLPASSTGPRLTALAPPKTSVGTGYGPALNHRVDNKTSNANKFPALPKSTPAKRFPGSKTAPCSSAWGSKSTDTDSSSTVTPVRETENQTISPSTSNSKKKGKKQVLYVFNTFHTG